MNSAKLKNPCLWLCLIGILLAFWQISATRWVVVYANGERVAMTPAAQGVPISLRFIHSVQKTPVIENLAVDSDVQGLVLHSTRYQSFGVGLPFLAEEGEFSMVGDTYVLNHMERRVPHLVLRTGVGTQLTLYLGYARREYRLYERYAPGTPIDIRIGRLRNVI